MNWMRFVILENVALLEFHQIIMNLKIPELQLQRFATSSLKDTGRTIEQVIENAEANIGWMDNNQDVIVRWLETMTKKLSLVEPLYST